MLDLQIKVLRDIALVDELVRTLAARGDRQGSAYWRAVARELGHDLMRLVRGRRPS